MHFQGFVYCGVVDQHPKTSELDNSGPNQYFLMIFFLFSKLDQDLSRKQPENVITQTKLKWLKMWVSLTKGACLRGQKWAKRVLYNAPF